jgi:hypothetical protein
LVHGCLMPWSHVDYYARKAGKLVFQDAFIHTSISPMGHITYPAEELLGTTSRVNHATDLIQLDLIL